MQKKTLIIGAAAVFLAFGVGVGAGGGQSTAAAEPAPAVTVSASPAPAVTVTAKPVEKRVEVKTAHPACLQALDLSEQGFTYAAEAMGYLNDAVQAAGRFNVAGLEASNAKLEILNPKLTELAPRMKAAAGECRAAG